ncbi:MAG: hypothetical protein AAGG44_15505, partial [Planctomycetota bacterium]
MTDQQTGSVFGLPATLWGCFLCLLSCGSAAADVTDEFTGLRYVSQVDFDERAVERLFRESQGQRCEVIPQSQPLEISSYVPVLTNLDRKKT